MVTNIATAATAITAAVAQPSHLSAAGLTRPADSSARYRSVRRVFLILSRGLLGSYDFGGWRCFLCLISWRTSASSME